MAEISPTTAISISGAPTQVDLNGLFFICDSSKRGNERVWRNRGTSRIYFDGVWKLGDVLSDTAYFTASVEATNPWDVYAEQWTPPTGNALWAEYRPQLTATDDPDIVTVPKRLISNIYTITTDSSFQYTKTYYKKDADLDKVYYLVTQINKQNKIDPFTFYEYNDKTDTYYLTTDTYFLSSKTYYTKFTKLAVDPTDGIEKEMPVYVEAVQIESQIPPNTYYNITGEEITNIVTTINNRTGEVSESRTTETKSYGDTLTFHERYALPNVEVGHVYQFSFVNDFKYLGYLPPTEEDYTTEDGEKDSNLARGIFRVDNITTYFNLVLSGIDIYQNLYLPLGISRSIFELDKKAWMNNDVWYKLVDPVLEPRVYYVPLSIIDGIPNANVQEYHRHQLIIDLDIFKDPELLDALVNDVNMLVRAKFGIPSTVELASYDKIYIPDRYYKWLDERRSTNAKLFMEQHGDQYYETLFYDKWNYLSKENNELRQKVNAYEEILSGGAHE